MSERAGQFGFRFNYWNDWTRVSSVRVDNDDGSTWGQYDDEKDVPRFNDVVVWDGANRQNNGRWGLAAMVGSGHDREYKGGNFGPNINDALINQYANSSYQVKVTVRYDNSGSGDRIWAYFDVRSRGTDIRSETYQDYTYDWTSQWHDIYAQRTQLSYQVTYQTETVNDFRPVIETITQPVMVTTFENRTDWQTQELIGTETITRAEITEQTINGIGAAFGEDMLLGHNINLQAGGRATLSALASATNDLSVTSGNTLQVRGIVADGADFAAPAELSAGNALTLNSRAALTLTAASRLSAADISLDASGALTALGVVGTEADIDQDLTNTQTLSVSAGADLSISGALLADNAMTLKAGQGIGRDGGITLASTAQLTTTAAASDISMTTGEFGGNLALGSALVQAQGANSTVTLTVVDGAIDQTGGLVSAHRLTATADNRLSMVGKNADDTRVAVTQFAEVDLNLERAGDLTLFNRGELTLVDVEVADGAIDITNIGNVQVTRAAALGDSDRNDIRLTTYRSGTITSADIRVETLSTTGRGDVILNAQGIVTRDSENAADLVADVLIIDAMAPITLNTQVNEARITTARAGHVSLVQSDRSLTLSATEVLDGSLLVEAQGDVVLGDVTLASNRAVNILNVNAAGDIALGRVVAGVLLADGDALPVTEDADGNAVTDATSAITVTLTSGGQIRESVSDAGVDLVANTLVARASSGIIDLDVALNRLDAVTTDGDIRIQDRDGSLEASQGLLILQAITAQNSGSLAADTLVEIGAVNNIITAADTQITGDYVRLVSQQGDIQVVTPTGFDATDNSGDSIDYTQGIGFSAVAGSLELYRFFTADTSMEYRAGERYLFGSGAAQTSRLPGNMTSDEIIIQTGGRFFINKNGFIKTA
jgi:hypothetical protein